MNDNQNAVTAGNATSSKVLGTINYTGVLMYQGQFPPEQAKAINTKLVEGLLRSDEKVPCIRIEQKQADRSIVVTVFALNPQGLESYQKFFAGLPPRWQNLFLGNALKTKTTEDKVVQALSEERKTA